MALTPAILAADIHKRMVDDNRFGYSWSERYGATTEAWTVDGVTFQIKVGDYDCSSSTITAWKIALAAFGRPGALDGATYTGNMRATFLRTGLFEWAPDSRARRGDLYLDESSHVAMCQGGGLMSEFSINEHGTVYGGLRGDQTGGEAKMSSYRDFSDGCLHYIGDLTLGDDDEVTPAEKKEIANMVVDELLNRVVAVNGERKGVPVWQLLSWAFFYSRNASQRLDKN